MKPRLKSANESGSETDAKTAGEKNFKKSSSRLIHGKRDCFGFEAEVFLALRL
jgi:hypothetical protein